MAAGETQGSTSSSHAPEPFLDGTDVQVSLLPENGSISICQSVVASITLSLCIPASCMAVVEQLSKVRQSDGSMVQSVWVKLYWLLSLYTQEGSVNCGTDTVYLLAISIECAFPPAGCNADVFHLRLQLRNVIATCRPQNGLCRPTKCIYHISTRALQGYKSSGLKTSPAVGRLLMAAPVSNMLIRLLSASS